MAHLGTAAATPAAGPDGGGESFWTACPHCCHVHSYPRVYLGRRLRCPTPACRRPFPATELAAPPPIVPGTDMYYCTWGFFPLGPPVTAEGWAPFIPFNPFDAPPSPSPAPTAAAAAAAATATSTPVRTGPTSRRKVCVRLKGRARAEAEEEEEAAAVNAESEASVGLWENVGSDIDNNEAVDLSELGFTVDELGVLHNSP